MRGRPLGAPLGCQETACNVLGATQWHLLQDHWAGRLESAVEEIRRRRGAMQFRMPQLSEALRP